MNSKFKRLLACLLSLMMVVSLFPMSAITAFAAEADEIATVSESTIASSGTWGGIDWTLTSDGTLTIAPTKGEPTTDNSGKWTYAVGEWPDAVIYNKNGGAANVGGWPYKKAVKIKHLVIEEGVTSIGSFAFSGVYGLDLSEVEGEVVIPSTVTYIGQEAFHKAPVSKLTFAKGGTEELCIAQGAFKNMSITEFALPDDRPVHIHAWNFLNSTKLEIVEFPANLTSFTGTNHVDYNHNPTTQTGGNAGSSEVLNNTNSKLEAIAFGSEAVLTLFKSSSGNGTAMNKVNGAYIISDEGVLTYCKSLTVAVKYAESGDTIKLLKNTDEAVEIPVGVTLDLNGFTAANITFAKPAVAQIGETPYESLTKAIAAAQAGQTITFVADITEDVTISKAVTIDGAGKTYTGSMTLKADTTIKNVNFDGKGYNGYAVNTRGAQYVTIEDCTVKNYGYGFAQLPSATALTTVKNVTVSNVNYGVKIDYSSKVVFENVDITAGVAAVLNSNYGEKSITIKDSKLNIIGTYTRNNTIKTAYVFEGANTVDQFIIEEALDSFKLAAGATLTAPNAVTVTTDVEDGTVVYGDGKYYVQTGLAGSGTEADPYRIGSVEDLIKFRDSVNAGETKYNAHGMYFVLTADIDLAGENWVGIGSATAEHGFMGNFDGNGFKIKNLTITNPTLDSDGYAYAGLFSVTEGTDKDNQNTIKNLTIENVTISTNGHIVAAAIAYPYYTIVENVTVCGNINITGGDYTAGALAYTRRCVNASNVTVSGNAGSTITGRYTVGGVISDIQMNGGLTAVYSNFAVSGVNITGEKNVGGISGIISGQTLNGASVKSVALVCSDASTGIVSGSLGSASTITNVVVENVTGADEMIGSIYNQQVNVAAQIGDTYYATFDAAIKAAKAGDTISLYAPIVVAKDETVVIDLKGATIVGAPSEAKAYAVITNYGNLTIKDSVGGGAIVCDHKLAGSTAYAVNTIVNSGTLIVEGGIIENKSTASNQIGYAIDNNSTSYDAVVVIKGGEVKASGSNYYDAIRLFCNNLNKENSVSVEGGKVSSIWLQNPSDGATKDTKDVKGSVTITGGTVDALYLEPSSAFEAAISGGYVGKVEYFTTSAGRDLAGFITGGTFGTDVTKFVADGLVVKKNADGTYGIATPVATVNGTNYATLAEAIKAATAGSTITLLADVNENVTINKNLTIDGADKNYTGTMTLGKANVTIESVNFVKGQVYKNKSTGTPANITIKDCDFDGQGMNAYAINLGGTSSIVIENVTAKDYGYGLLQVPSSCAGLTVKNVTVSGCYYGLKVDYANAVTIENADIDATVGIYDSNFGTKTYSIKDSKISSISIWQRNTTNYTTFKFEGVNEVNALSTSQYAKYVGVQVGTKIYSSLADAFAAAQDGDTIKVLGNIAVSDAITNTKKVTLDLNGKTITGTDNATGSFAIITNKGELTITGNGKMTLTATNNRGWNAYSSVISNTVGGKLIVESGTIEHLGGTDMAYGIDNLTNGKGTYAETIINGGTIKSTYRAIRMFLNGIEAQNILTVNGGVIEGANKSIWMQDPSKNANTGKLTVAEGATLNGDVYLFVTAGSTEYPVEVSIAASAVNGEVLIGNFPAGYILEKANGIYTVEKYAAVIGGKYYFKTLEEAVAAAQNKNVITLLCDSEGAGIVIDKNITIDFNGFTYTLVGDGAGSANTKTNGFQILKGNTVEFKNGTVKVADEAASKYAMLIQNYANLKIRNMTLDGTNLDRSAKVSYVVSINSGRVYFIGDVVIKSNDRNLAGDVAIDVYDYSAAGYDVPMVDIPETVKIDEYSTIADASKAGKVLAAARSGKVFYATLQQAIDATPSITLVQDYVGPGFVIDKQVNFNLNGFTLTINEGVGSANTKTNGIQILKGAKVGLSNGKIEAANNSKLAILIQNYGDLQITNVELDGTNLDYSSKVSFTLSINSGNVKLMGTTNVIANDRNLPGDIAIDVYDYSAAGYERPVVSIYSTVTYTEGKLYAAAKYGNYHYSSLQQCIDKHGTATLVCDFEGPGVVFNKNATINFNGYTYTFTSGVGSTGTESNGFQILKGNRVTLNNGTLKVADSAANKFYILVQNYADLTLNSMTLDGTNLDKWSKTDGDSYTLSNNSGNVMINGTSKIIANNDGDKAFAFDVCDKTAAGYELPLVKVAATASIEGNIEAAVKIGNRYYATLAQAIADRDNGSSKDEIVLMSNIVLKDTLTIEATKAIVLDLNGYTISQEKACTGHYAMIVNKAILTIKDSVGGGKISFTDTGAGDPNFTWGSYTIVNENKLYVNGGTIENLSAQNANGSVKHMYCAIQQNNTKAQLQINGGTISTPSYRSIRINAGSLTFGAWATTEEGATIEGQVWIQPFADGIKVNVNNGKFSPAGVDSSSIYVDNSSKTVAFRINGGAFETKIGCSNADALKGAIRGGSFTEAAIEKTNATLFHKNFVNA